MTEIWINFTQFIGTNERANTILYMFKRVSRELNTSIRISSAVFLFKLLEIFAIQRNPSAPIIYKMLVFNIVENPTNLTIRELYFWNF